MNPSPPTTQQPPTTTTINLASIPTTKIKSKTKTHIQSERENRSERKRESELEKENSPSPPLQTTMPSPSITKPPRCHRRSSVHTVDVDLQSTSIWERQQIRERGERKEDEKWKRGVAIWLKEERVIVLIVLEYLQSIVATNIFFWVLLVDCVGVSEFDHGFVYIFACLDAKKLK